LALAADLEVVPAIACGVLTYFLLPSRLREANFLTREEKKLNHGGGGA